MRPTYENTSTLKHESTFAVDLGRVWRCLLVKVPVKYCIDTVAMRNGSPVAWVELKNRDASSNAFGEYMLALSKWKEGRELAAATKLPFMLAVRWSDCDTCVRLDGEAKIRLGFGGRVDRGDWQDKEPMVYIPMSQFTRVPTRERTVDHVSM